MPSAVQTIFPAAKTSRARGANPSQLEPVGEGFHDELLRQRRADANEKPDVAKAEPQKSPAARKATRGGRENAAPPADEVEAPPAAAEPAAEVATDNDAGEVALAGEAAGVGSGQDENSESTQPNDALEAIDPAAASAIAGMVAFPAQTVGPQSGALDSVSGQEALAENKLETLAAARTPGATVYHGVGDAPQASGQGPESGGAPAGEGGAEGAGMGLFAQASGEEASADGDGDAGQAGGFQMPDDADVDNSLDAQPADYVDARGAKASAPSIADASTAGLMPGTAEVKAETRNAAPTLSQSPAAAPEVRFATDNHEKIVTSMRSELLPNGGSMRIRLDPPQLGAMQVTVQFQDGFVTASFETSSDEATRLLGHSLNQLKSVLESHGVLVDKLQVQQVPRDAQAFASNDDAQRDQGRPSQDQEHAARQEQQRREMLRRMWQRLAGGQDPLDLTA